MKQGGEEETKCEARTPSSPIYEEEEEERGGTEKSGGLPPRFPDPPRCHPSQWIPTDEGSLTSGSQEGHRRRGPWTAAGAPDTTRVSEEEGTSKGSTTTSGIRHGPDKARSLTYPPDRVKSATNKGPFASTTKEQEKEEKEEEEEEEEEPYRCRIPLSRRGSLY